MYYNEHMSPETSLKDIVPLVPDHASRQEEISRLRELSGAQRVFGSSPRGPFQTLTGKGILFSAPHEATHIRDGVEKRAEIGTAALAFALASYTDGSALATLGIQLGDPNWDLGSPYLDRAMELAGSSAVVDLHIMRPRGVEICLGLGPEPRLSAGLWNVLLEEAVAAGLRASINWPFGANARTITGQLQRRGVRAIQIELSSECFDPRHMAMQRAWTSVARAARRLAQGTLDAVAQVRSSRPRALRGSCPAQWG